LQLAVGVFVVPLMVGLFAWLVIGCALSCYPDAGKIFNGTARRIWRRDALVALVLSLAAGAGLSRVDALLTNMFHAYASFNDELFPPDYSTLWPAGGIFISILTRTILSASAAAVAILIIRTGWKLRAWWLWLGLMLILVSFGPTHAHSLREFAAGWVMAFLPLLVVVLLVGFFLRDNILAYFVVLFGGQAAEALINLFSQPSKYFVQNGVALALLVGIVLAWMLLPSGKSEKSAG